MLRKLIVSAILSTSALSALALAPAAASADPPRHYRHGYRFEVNYRDHGSWRCYGTYPTRYEADRVARDLRHRHYLVRVEREHY
jgi:hypothetical protein